MYSNGPCTLYRPGKVPDAYTRTTLPAVYWEDCCRTVRLKTGAQAEDSALLLIPMAAAPRPVPGQDYLVRGHCDFEVTGQEGQTLSDLMRAFDAKVVISCDSMDMGSGSMQHWEVGLK